MFVFTAIIVLVLIKNSQELCQSNLGVTSCKNEVLTNRAPIRISDYRKLLQFEKGHITDITSEAFKNLPNVEKLILSNNLVNNIQQGAFKSFYNISEISLYNNKLETIQRDVFTSKTLRVLDLGMNSINLIEPEAFKTLENLEELNLAFNKLKATPNALKSLTNLKTLRLDNNQLQALQPKSFEDLHSLHTLDLSNNKINDIQANAFQGLSNLKDLNLKSNYLSHFDTAGLLNNLKSLKTIHININSFKCKDLMRVISELEARRVQVPNGFSKSKVSYRGMSCIN
ncbi:unnamed protein product [Brassicogethes aeneus]|uniref:Uncharacterized protein n=1 Tax=Brassicogethes aeneus TaxID=1431903 RepID=A0A9P0BCP1_BRAAE|nr:unnamed protein product [Brassicogethes aeneus]